MKEVYKRGELAKEILKGFLAGGLVVSCVVFPGMAHILTLMNATNARERQRVKQSVNQLEKRGLLVRRIKNGKEEIVVTSKGRRRLSEYLLEDLHIKRPKKWDKKWRILMFDIPETKKHIRDEVSFWIKDIGMETIQNSVFASPFPCKTEIDFIARHYSVREYFIYFEADNIEGTPNLLRTFNLT